MKTITQYRDDISKMLKKAEDIDTKAISESRDLTEGELALKNELLDSIEETEKIVATMERQERVKKHLEDPPEAATRPKPRKADPDIEMPEDSRAKDRFASFGQQMAAVMRAGVPGGHVDPRLFNTQGSTGLSESVPSDGGFLVQTDFANQLLQDTFETGLLASRCREIQISGNSNSTTINGVDESSRADGSRQGGIQAYWADEAEEKTKSKPKFRQIELKLKKLVGLCYATDEMLDDASQLEGIIRNGFTSEFGFSLDNAILRGTGSGQPLGVLNSGSLVTQAKESGQAADTVVAENVINMWSRLFAPSRANAVWLINQEIEPQLQTMMVTKTHGSDGITGQLIYMPPGGISGSPYGTLYGRPVVPVEQCSAIGDKGDIVLGDFSNGYVLARKGGMEAAMSIHVRFIYDESVFRFVLRVDGQPVRSKPLTPYKGSNTLSHFVTLAQRD